MKKTVQENLQDLTVTATWEGEVLMLHFDYGETPPDVVDTDTNGAFYIHGDDLHSLIAVLQEFVK